MRNKRRTDRRIQEIIVCLFLILSPVIAYREVLRNGFVGYDDTSYIVENKSIQAGLTGESITWAFTSSRNANWHPLTWISHMLDYQLFGLDPSGHHLTSLVLHIINTVLLFWILKAMTSGFWQSAFAAALFALHPLHVESVAWVAERKDVLSTLFWLLTMGTYAGYTKKGGRGRYFLMLLFFALGLMAKPMLVTLPFVLLLLDYWPLDRFNQDQLVIKKAIVEKLPLFALSIASCIVTFFAQQHGGAVQSITQFPLRIRIANALVSYAEYITKVIWPSPLAVYYPHPGNTIPGLKVAGSSIFLVSLTLLFLGAARKRPYCFTGWLWYLGTLVPVIGLVQIGGQAMADRYTYIPHIGLFIIMCWGIADLTSGWRYRDPVLGVAAILVIFTAVMRTQAQVHVWKDGLTLFKHTIEVTDNNYASHNFIGITLTDKGEFEEALRHLKKAIRIKPDFAEAYNNIAMALHKQGNLNDAITYYRESLRIKPDSPRTYNNMGLAFFVQKRWDDAMVNYKEAIRHDPGFADAYSNIGTVYYMQGKLDKAVNYYKKALRIMPDHVDARANLEVVLRRRVIGDG